MVSRVASTVGACVLVVLLAACSGEEISEPWVPEYKEPLYGDERVRDEAVTKQLDQRLRYTQVDR